MLKERQRCKLLSRGPDPLSLPCYTVSRCEDVTVGDEAAAAELLARLEEHGYPGELVRTGIGAAHNPLLVGRHRVLVAALQRQALRTGGTRHRTAGGRRGCGRRSGIAWVAGSLGGNGTETGAGSGALRARNSGGGRVRGVVMVRRVRGQRRRPAAGGGRMRGQRWRPLGHSAREGAKGPLVRVDRSGWLSRHRLRHFLFLRLGFGIGNRLWSVTFDGVDVLEVRHVLDAVRIINGILRLGSIRRWLFFLCIHIHLVCVCVISWLLGGRRRRCRRAWQWKDSKGIGLDVRATNAIVDSSQLIEKVAQISVQTDATGRRPLAQGDKGQLAGHSVVLTTAVDPDTHTCLATNREALGALQGSPASGATWETRGT